jgi:Disulphide bond corrector protein DsbC
LPLERPGRDGKKQTKATGKIMRKILLVSFFPICALGLAANQNTTTVVEARVVTATDAAHANSLFKAAVVAQVTSGFHINSHKPTLEYLIPTELKLEPAGRITVKDVIYPKGEPKKFAFSDTPLSVYEGTVLVGAVFQVGRAAHPGIYSLQGKLGYQACNDHACLPPASVPVIFTIKVVPRDAPLKRVNADVFNRLQLEKQ